MKNSKTKLLGVAALSLILGLGLGQSTVHKDKLVLIDECEAVLPRYQTCEIIAVPTPMEPHD